MVYVPIDDVGLVERPGDGRQRRRTFSDEGGREGLVFLRERRGGIVAFT